jgi:hypothetical protein
MARVVEEPRKPTIITNHVTWVGPPPTDIRELIPFRVRPCQSITDSIYASAYQ